MPLGCAESRGPGKAERGAVCIEGQKARFLVNLAAYAEEGEVAEVGVMPWILRISKYAGSFDCVDAAAEHGIVDVVSQLGGKVKQR
jgi:hypothetical protein